MTKWLDRSLVESPIYYCLCTSEKEYIALCKKMKIPKEKQGNWLSSDATVHFFENSEAHKSAAIVCIDTSRGHSKEQLYALLVHEAVHIWQDIKQLIGEKSPSIEFEAYSIQRLCLELFCSMNERLNDS